jgi:hypothetical protein
MKSSITRFAGAAALCYLAGYAFIALQGPQGIPGLMEKRRLIREYEKKNADMARKIEEQRARIGRFSDSPSGPGVGDPAASEAGEARRKGVYPAGSTSPAAQTRPALV